MAAPSAAGSPRVEWDAGSSPVISPRDGPVQLGPQQQLHHPPHQQAPAGRVLPAVSAGPATAELCHADVSSMSGGMFALPGPGWGGVTPYHKYMIHETSGSYICTTSMPGNGRQEEEVARAAFKGTVNRSGGTCMNRGCLLCA